MAAADLERGRWRTGDLARTVGLARSLVIYYGQPWRLWGLRRRYREFLRPGDLAFDIGAHVGNRTRCFRGLGARVVAVEPQPDFAAWLHWQFRSDPGVTVVAAALGATPGKATLHISWWTPTVTTLSRGWTEQVRQEPGFAGVAWPGRCEVSVTTLDDLIARHGRPRFCKLDVEGSEAQALRGLSSPIPALSLEYLPAAIEVALEAVERLAELGTYRFNVTQGERLRWLWPDWRGARATVSWLGRREPEEPSGDVWARLEAGE